jgi:hypothetical protein
VQKSDVRKSNLICILVLLCGWLARPAWADTYQLTTGQSITGDPVSMNEQGTLFSLPDGTYSDRVPWGKFSQADLKKIVAANPKAQQFVEPFMEPDQAQKKEEQAAIEVKSDYAKLDRPAPEPFLKALASTGIGLFAFFLIYCANIYAGYEVSIFRVRSAGLVCGVSAVLPVLGPIIFLCLPTQVESKADIVQEPAREKEVYHAGEVPPEGEMTESSYAAEAASKLPPTEKYARGQYTFNRRFFETKFPGFFSVVRREADRDMVLIFRAARGTYEAQRITRVSMNDLHIQVVKGAASEEVVIPFIEIQEVTVKHKDV